MRLTDDDVRIPRFCFKELKTVQIPNHRNDVLILSCKLICLLLISDEHLHAQGIRVRRGNEIKNCPADMACRPDTVDFSLGLKVNGRTTYKKILAIVFAT